MKRLLGIAANVVTYAVMALAIAGGLTAVAVARDAVRIARVATGSMHPSIEVGALVAGVPAEGRDLAVGDVVMFRPPAPFADDEGTPVAHRVVAIETQGERRVLRTRGDANAAADPWALDAAGTTFYRVRFDSLAAGRLTAAVDPGNPRIAMNFALIPGWIVALRLIWSDRTPPRHRAPRDRRRRPEPIPA